MSQMLIYWTPSGNMQINNTTRYEIYIVIRYLCSMLYSFFRLLLHRVFQEKFTIIRENVL
jgi:hypothetical protein